MFEACFARGRARRSLGIAVALCLGHVAVGRAQVGTQSVDSSLAVFSPGDRVLGTATLGDTIYLAGSFSRVGPSTGGGVPVDAVSGSPLNFPRVVGEVRAVLRDGSGGWYVGGHFSYVAAEPRSNLVHIAADGSVLPWAPNPDGEVWALTLEGQTLFLGGDFGSIGGLPRGRVAAIDVATGVPLPFRCDADQRVDALLLGDGKLYLGGWFSELGGVSRAHAAAVDPLTGEVAAWQVNLDGEVDALAISDTTVFIGGYFINANGQFHWGLAAVGSESGALHSWDAQLQRVPPTSRDGGPHVLSLIVLGQTLLVGGSFSSLGGQPRPGIAALDINTALATPWAVSATSERIFGPEFWTLAVSGDTLYLAGQCSSLAGSPADNIGAVSLTTGARLGWNPRTNDFVNVLTRDAGAVFLGGRFTSIGDAWVDRNGLAAISLKTGRVTDWDPNPSDYVKSIFAWGRKIYVGGYFFSVGGKPRQYLAALDPVSGEATDWAPFVGAPPWAINAWQDRLLVGGIFSSIYNRPQHGLAAIDTSTGLPVDWDPGIDGDVYALAVTDSVIYVGGDFTMCGGQARSSLAAVDPVTGAAFPWNPSADRSVMGLALLHGTVFLGGNFLHLAGAARSYLAAVDTSGSLTAWAPDADNTVEAIAASDSTVYVGGLFSSVAGASLPWFAALDATSGGIRSEYPRTDAPVWSLQAGPGKVFVGGAFSTFGRFPQQSFALLSSQQSNGGPPPGRADSPICFPNPIRAEGTVRYALPSSMTVTLTVYDLQGRIVAKPLARVVQSAGQHDILVNAEGWTPGCYLYRLETGSLTTTKKLVVLR